MTTFHEYFVAPDDESAAITIEWPSGPAAGPRKRALRRREPGYDTVEGWGIDPEVHLGMLQEMLTGRTFQEQLAGIEACREIAIRDGGMQIVFALDDRFMDQLIRSDDALLERLAGPWAEIEDFRGDADPRELVEFLVGLRRLARTRGPGGHVYCWIAA